jgi:hypothetical protein
MKKISHEKNMKEKMLQDGHEKRGSVGDVGRCLLGCW